MKTAAPQSTFVDPATLTPGDIAWADIITQKGRAVPRSTDTNVAELLSAIGAKVYLDTFRGDEYIFWHAGLQRIDDTVVRSLYMAATRCGMTISRDMFDACVSEIADQLVIYQIRLDNARAWYY